MPAYTDITVPAWDNRSTAQALAEGWMIFNGDEIQYDIEAALLEDDDAAIDLVTRRAEQGSPMHQLALRIHQAGLATRASTDAVAP